MKISEIHNALKGCAKTQLKTNMSCAMASAMGKKGIFPLGHSTATIFYFGRLTLPLVSDSGHSWGGRLKPGLVLSSSTFICQAY